MICIAENIPGKGGVAGGAGSSGQPSQSNTGYGSASYGRPVLSVTTGMTVSLPVQLTNDIAGTIPANLSAVDTVRFVAAPTVLSGAPILNINCTFTAAGAVTVPFTPAQLSGKSGVWYAEFQCLTSGNVVKVFKAYLHVIKSISDASAGVHPITIGDIRLALMDADPSGNELLDDLEFSDEIIIACIQRAIDEWNETSPELSVYYDHTTFPYREHLLRGVMATMLQAMGTKMLRNQMNYSAAGLSMDLNAKGPVYLQLAAEYRKEWKLFIKGKKNELNMEECCGFIDMPGFQ